MADEKKLEEEYFESEIYTLVDEDGGEEEFELIGKYMEDGVTYNALIPADESKQNGEYIILRREEDENGDVYLATIEDDDEFDRIADIFDDSFSDLQVVFGEDGGFVIENSSMIVSKIKKGGKDAGSLGIIGPMRLNYAKVIPYIEYLTERITEIISDDDDIAPIPPLSLTDNDGNN